MKTKIAVCLSILILVTVIYISKPNKIDFKETQLNALPPKIHTLIPTLNKGKGYLFLPKEQNNKNAPFYFYFDRNDHRHLYSYPAAEVSVEKDTLHLDIQDQDALNDSEATDTLILEFQSQSVPEQLKVIYKNNNIEIEQITY